LTQIGVLGAGAWGTALAQVAASAGSDVDMWALEAEVVDAINDTQQNSVFLPGFLLDSKIKATSDLGALGACEVVLAVVPAQYMRTTLQKLSAHLKANTAIVLCSKGIEQGSLKLMAEVVRDVLPNHACAVLSGPSFAKDVVIGLPTAVTLACKDAALGEKLTKLIGIATFRPYLVDDLVGAEIGGAVKNVLAIACGMAEGRGLGESARAALITRGFAEMTRLGVALGADPRTLAGLCGLGDLVLTCSSKSSRNFSLGFALGASQSLAEAMDGKKSVAEGAATAPALLELAVHNGVDMPICAGVAAILAGRIEVGAAIESLLSRPLKSEAH
jgi:glycerol-3-phosphate dehydrogenase (NAD(P)+)